MENKTSSEVLSRTEINQLSRAGRAIVIFEGEVYDATDFKGTHPGGPKFIDDYVGKDMTEVFYEEEHTKIALRMLKDMKIGTLETFTSDQMSQDTVTSHSRMGEIEGEEWRMKVDPKLGTVWQVFSNLNHEEYNNFINDPKHLTRPDDEHRMFATSWIEFFSRTPWYHVALFWTPIASYKLYEGSFELTPLEFILTCIFAIICWTFAEYALHRFVFHMEVYMPDNAYFRATHYIFHGIHHAFPMDPDRLVFPIIMAYFIWNVFHVIWINTLPGIMVNTFTGAFIFSYMGYDLGHYYFHHSQPLKITEYRKKYHMYHHYKDPDNGYGITTSFWDKIFGTELVMNKKKEN
uniref:Fatty acid 2-hydroxylase n=1 Tax=Euplotes crassus TaxID=5936 RepID=A0A7S3K966_EUPCR|mmetsp:Transcript_1369/g.1311  ORF Transcript_1369/g.1311 Transcript_1369/m.1311 type:complete len:348 (+) Transcript_1369:1-1044(+)